MADTVPLGYRERVRGGIPPLQGEPAATHTHARTIRSSLFPVHVFLTRGFRTILTSSLILNKGEEHHPNAGEYDTGNGEAGAKESVDRDRPKYPLSEGKETRPFYCELALMKPVPVTHSLLPHYIVRLVCKRENLPGLLSVWLSCSLWGASFYTTFVW